MDFKILSGAKDKVHEPGDDSSVGKVSGVDPRWPYLNKWSVTVAPSLQPSISASHLTATEDLTLSPQKSTTLHTGTEVHTGTEDLTTSPPKSTPFTEVDDLIQQETSVTDLTQVLGSEANAASKLLGSNLSLDPATSSPPPSLGAWTIPLKLSSFNPMGTNNRDHGPSSVLSDSQWPSLSKQMDRKQAAPGGTSASVRPNESNPIIKAASQEYPWAAKMKSVCNLNRVTVPVYLEDGTHKVTVPSHVLLQGIENQKEYVVGQFYRCSAPPGGLIHAVVTKIWGKKCRIFIKKLGESSYLFHIPDEATRKFVIQRGIWHIDDCLMFVSVWTPSTTIALPEVKTIPVWLSLKNIPNQLYSIEGIKWIASGIGEPMLTYKQWLDPTLIGEAKILVEVKLDKPFAQRVAIEDESGFVSMVNVLYSWLPSKCARCGQLGHKASRCLGQPLGPASNTKTSSPISEDVEISVKSAGETEGMLEDKEERVPSITHSVLNVNVPLTSSSVVDASAPVIAPQAAVKHKDQITIAKENSDSVLEQDYSFSQEGKVGGSPNTITKCLSTREVTGNTTTNSFTLLVSSQEIPSSSSKQVSTNSVRADSDCKIRRSLSSSNLLTNRFSSLESSDEDDDASLPDEDLDPKENLSPLGKVFLRDRPVKPSTKAREMQSHPVARGRGNRNRGNRGRGKRGGCG